MFESLAKLAGSLKTKETPKVIIVIYSLYLWQGIFNKTSITELSTNILSLILISLVIFIITVAGLVFIHKQRMKV